MQLERRLKEREEMMSRKRGGSTHSGRFPFKLSKGGGGGGADPKTTSDLRKELASRAKATSIDVTSLERSQNTRTATSPEQVDFRHLLRHPEPQTGGGRRGQRSSSEEEGGVQRSSSGSGWWKRRRESGSLEAQRSPSFDLDEEETDSAVLWDNGREVRLQFDSETHF